MPVLTVDSLSKKYGSLRALHNVSFGLDEGEAYGCIGPNGAGKTTAIRVILGILRPSGGSTSVFGMDSWKNAADIHKRIAYVPGEVNLWPNLTGGEVIDFFLSLRGKGASPNKEKRDSLIERFKLEPGKKCRAYSKGNRQKVALVAAFASEAELYILDEPTSGLDPLMAQVFGECVKELKADGKSILLSSHILSEVERLCDRIGILRGGVLVEEGRLGELRHLTRTSVSVTTEHPAHGLAAIPGVHNLSVNKDCCDFSADSEYLPEIIGFLSPLRITRLTSSPPSLETLFLSHYNNSRPEEL